MKALFAFCHFVTSSHTTLTFITTWWLGTSEPLSFVRILSWVFYPFAFLLGLQTSDVPIAARLLGERVILTEAFSYNHLAQSISSGQITNPRTVVILSCAFADSHTWQRWQSL